MSDINDPIYKQDLLNSVRNKAAQREIPLQLIQIQDNYNKRNIEQQHKLNLELFKKQSRLTIYCTILAGVLSFIASLAGVWFGFHLNKNIQKQTQQQNQTIQEEKIHHKASSTEAASQRPQKVKNESSEKEKDILLNESSKSPQN